ncbi:MAG TPA: gliding motility-associated C-terminal domain-containing protein [Niastella sp.]
MNPLSLPYLIIGCIITFWCNSAHAQVPVLQISNNPTTCQGSEGAITFSALTPNATFQISYIDDGITKGPVTFVANGAGQITIPNLNAGRYTSFIFNLNGAITVVPASIKLSDPEFPVDLSSVPRNICKGDPAPVLPPISDNGYSGTWSPAVVDNQATGSYTFTPTPGSCGEITTITITVTPRIDPQFSFPNSLTICGSGPVPTLPNTSLNGITGTWSPAVVDPNNSGVYVFTPTSSGCVNGTTFTVTVNPNITSSFPFNMSASICDGEPVPVLPKTSTNGITGVWSPAVVSNTTSGIYSFTPDPGQCAVPVTYTVTVNPIITPVFNINTTVSICSAATAPVLPATSTNGITGTWSPAVVSNTATGTYTFTPTSDRCAPPVKVTVTVNPIIIPAFSFNNAQSVCINATPLVLPAVSTNGITGTWSPATVDNQNSGTYTFTPDAGQCASNATLTYQVNPIPSVVSATKTDTVYDGTVLPPYDCAVNIPVTGINWINTDPTIGLPVSGSGTVPSFRATNMTDDPVTAIVTATPYVNGCMGIRQTYKIIVRPLNKDLFVPNVFSPNGDRKNDLLLVYGTYISTLDMRIFNQWGQQMVTITDKNQGWDGKFRGSPQPVGVYVYVLKAVMTDGRTVNKKGSITLVR